MNSGMRHQLLPILALLALALLVTLSSVPAHADRRRWPAEAGAPHDFAPHRLAQQRISIEQAIAIAQRETGGRVLDARDQGQQYRIKILTRRGEVRIVYVDATTGATR
jgi:uncharacterized membrane protein YkoI